MTDTMIVDTDSELPLGTYATGDVVRLNSGGPAMTVEAVGASDDGDVTVAVSWLANDGTPYDAEYPIEMLQPLEGLN